MRIRSVLLALALAPFASAGTIHVPGDQPGIQAALDVAQPGDEIVLAPNIYGISDGLLFHDSNITLRGETGDPLDVTLTGGGAHAPISVTLLTGLAFRAITFSDCNTVVSLNAAQAEFDNCRFFRNIASTNPHGTLVSLGSNITVNGCTFERHTSANPSPGGAIAAYGGTLTVTGSTFFFNTAAAGDLQPSSRGASIFTGGIFLAPGVAEGTTLTVTDTTFHDNACDFGAAISTVGADTEVDRCRFVNNTSTFGGAIFADRFVSGNTSLPGALRVTNSVFENNQAVKLNNLNGLGAAIGAAGGTSIEAINNTFHRNVAEGSGGAYYAFGTVASSVLANNLSASNSTPDFVAQGPLTSANNLSGDDATLGLADPLGPDGEAGTLDENFRLLAGSPAIDAGDNTYVPADRTTDLDDMPRFVDDPATPDTGVGTPPIVDIGAYEFVPPPPCGPADLAPPYGTLDLADVLAFVIAFTSQDPAADFDANGIYDLADVVSFITAFNAGCP
ncbi:MAG: hypothetical protein H6810_07865 [Phycisphaeraceae bacterium]|nr:MAG: hypothetical protein H6810_07865 [Phycisphaeraceae bacterium]